MKKEDIKFSWAVVDFGTPDIESFRALTSPVKQWTLDVVKYKRDIINKAKKDVKTFAGVSMVIFIAILISNLLAPKSSLAQAYHAEPINFSELVKGRLLVAEPEFNSLQSYKLYQELYSQLIRNRSTNSFEVDKRIRKQHPEIKKGSQIKKVVFSTEQNYKKDFIRVFWDAAGRFPNYVLSSQPAWSEYVAKSEKIFMNDIFINSKKEFMTLDVDSFLADYGYYANAVYYYNNEPYTGAFKDYRDNSLIAEGNYFRGLLRDTCKMYYQFVANTDRNMRPVKLLSPVYTVFDGNISLISAQIGFSDDSLFKHARACNNIAYERGVSELDFPDNRQISALRKSGSILVHRFFNSKGDPIEAEFFRLGPDSVVLIRYWNPLLRGIPARTRFHVLSIHPYQYYFQYSDSLCVANYFTHFDTVKGSMRYQDQTAKRVVFVDAEGSKIIRIAIKEEVGSSHQYVEYHPVANDRSGKMFESSIGGRTKYYKLEKNFTIPKPLKFQMPDAYALLGLNLTIPQ